jgi:chromosome segregation ATPase
VQVFAIDTLKVSRRLRDAGFDEAQADAFITTFQEAAETSDVVSKGDLRDVETSLRQGIADLRAEVVDIRTEITDLRGQLRQTETALRAEIGAVRVELQAEIAAVRAELRETELRLEAKIEAVRALIGEAKADVLTRVFAMIAGAVVINVIAIFGAMIGIAKLLGH